MKTLAQKLKNRIACDYIQSGVVSPGGKLPTIREIARKYNSNTTTISKVVAMLAAEGLVIKKQSSGIYCAPNASMRVGQKSTSHKKIGVVVPDMEEILSHRILTGIEEVMRRYNCSLEIANSNHDVLQEQHHIDAMVNRGIDGIVLKAVANRSNDKEYLAGNYREVPIVVVDSYHSEMKRSHVVFDNFTAGREMTNYLIYQGCRRIAFYKFDDLHKSLEERFEGYKVSLQDNNIPYQPELVISRGILTDLRKQKPDNVFSAIHDLMSLVPKPDAIIAPMDYCAGLFISYIMKNAPSELGRIVIVGFDNDKPVLPAISYVGDEWLRWPTTSPDFRRMGSRAAELLLKNLEDTERNLETEVLLPCPLLLPSKTKTEAQSKYAGGVNALVS